ncbi:MAG: carboxymuconolactone decarboxylase family protein [Acidobacteria bacterium]|nr:carboxymuconolactone decarboxylase family protein [Acidobacteriota bacterium]
MKQRLNLMENVSGAMQAMYGLESYLAKSSLEKNLLHLLKFRVSQINGCAYCLDMHSKDLRAAGETEQRIYLLAAWRESPFYSERERVALEWAESLTTLNENGVSDEVYERAKKQFSETELIDLTLAVVAINGWNRLNIAFRTEPGSYQPGQFTASQKA